MEDLTGKASKPAKLALAISIGSVVAVITGTLPIITTIQTSAVERGRLEQRVTALESDRVGREKVESLEQQIKRLDAEKVSREGIEAKMGAMQSEMKRIADELGKLNERERERKP